MTSQSALVTSELVLRNSSRRLPTGTVRLALVENVRMVGSAAAAATSFVRSAALETLPLDRPVGSVKRAVFMPRVRALAFIALRHAGKPPG
jgi:hypothetical protein